MEMERIKIHPVEYLSQRAENDTNSNNNKVENDNKKVIIVKKEDKQHDNNYNYMIKELNKTDSNSEKDDCVDDNNCVTQNQENILGEYANSQKNLANGNQNLDQAAGFQVVSIFYSIQMLFKIIQGTIHILRNAKHCVFDM
jgi:hypothetical protein